MTFRPSKAHVVSHTHWDREWYFTFEAFRARLNRVVGEVLDRLEHDASFERFLLDGQAVALEDHLEVHPEDESRIRRLARSGALSLGPFYVLPDELLIGPEATVRNLLIGHEVCSRFGPVQDVGYMPDSFGHPAQTPQLLQQAGITSFVYQRGNGDEIDELGHEYFWRAPDGSEVLAVNLCEGYCNGAALGHEEFWHAHTARNLEPEMAVARVGKLFDKMGERTNSSLALIMNGCDHHPPQREFGRMMAALKQAFPEVEFSHASLDMHLQGLRAEGAVSARFEGELLSGKLSLILSGVWSTRVPLKQRNERCHSLLADQWEPLSCIAHFLHGKTYPAGAIKVAWKELLKNQPHDSICGCSVDEVHEDMEQRYEAVERSAVDGMALQLADLVPTFARRFDDDKDTVLCVANSLPRPRTEVIERLVVLQPHCAPLDQLRLLDESGKEVEFTLIEDWFVERFWGVDHRTTLDTDLQLERFAAYREEFGDRILKSQVEGPLTDRYLFIQFQAELPAMGHANFHLTSAEAASPAAAAVEPVQVEGSVMSNGTCSVQLFPNGTLDLTDERSGRVYRGLNYLEDGEDIGDEYDYSPAEGGSKRSSGTAVGTVSVVFRSPLRATLEARFDLLLPAGIAPGRRARSTESVACPVRVRVTLSAGSPVVDIDLRFGNWVKDHRLRARFPMGIETDRILSDGHFLTNDRPLEPPTGDDWAQPAPGTWPQQEFSVLQDEEQGLALLARGLNEVEAFKDADGGTGLYLTLLRAVGWLSRDDFSTRRFQNAGPTVPTPAAQCLGKQRFRYALMPFEGDWVDAGVKHRGREWRTAPLVVQGVEDQSVRGGEALVTTLTERTCITAVKRHERRDSLVVRLYNLTSEPVNETLTSARRVLDAVRVDLLERPTEEELSRVGERAVQFRLRGHGIATIELKLES